MVNLRQRTEAALKASVLSTRIEELTDDQTVARWVEHGIALHRHERQTDICRFCEQPLRQVRMQSLENHFNDEFNKQKQTIVSLLEEIDYGIEFLKNSQSPPIEALYDSLRTEYGTALNELKSQSSILSSALAELKRALNSKLDNPFKSLELSTLTQQVGGGEGFKHLALSLLALVADGAPFIASFAGAKALYRLNAVIARHNELTSSFDVSVKKARDSLAQDEVLGALEEWVNHNAKVAECEKKKSEARAFITSLKAEIASLEARVRQHHRPADELSRELAAYLGRSEFKFIAERNGYRIMRGAEPATHLSDGERTAVAFIYFLKSLQGADFDISQSIIVIDDPVSSLDANSLFSAFAFMKERTSNAKQLIVLTHNFSFFRQVRNWFDNLNKRKKQTNHDKQARFFALSTVMTEGKRGACLSELDSFLTNFESEYHYLFKKVHELSQLAPGVSLEKYYSAPNMARRLLEFFVAYRVPGQSGELFKTMQVLRGDAAAKTRVLRFLHTFSHGDAIAQPEHDPSILLETRAVLKDLLELIHTNDQAHYEGMVELCEVEA